MIKKKIIRASRIAYPVVAACLYLCFPYAKTKKVAEIEAELAELRSWDKVEDDRAAAELRRQDLLGRIDVVIAKLRERVERFDANEVAIFVKGIANRTGVGAFSLNVKTRPGEGTYSFFVMDMEVEGSFADLVSFLRGMEEDRSRFVALDQIRIDPTRRTAKLRLRATVRILATGPPELPPEKETPEGGMAGSSRPTRT